MSVVVILFRWVWFLNRVMCFLVLVSMVVYIRLLWFLLMIMMWFMICFEVLYVLFICVVLYKFE